MAEDTMTFWSSQTVREALKGGELVRPFELDRVKQGAYELSLGPEVFVGSAGLRTKQSLAPGAQVAVPPGQFALLLTEEEIQIPLNAIGLISIRAGIKFRGLINVSGFHVDPGFKGRLKFAVYNAGSENVILARHERVFVLWLASFDSDVDDAYRGEHFCQTDLSSQDVMRLQGHVASPAALQAEISALRLAHEQRLSSNETNIVVWRALTITLFVLVIGAVMTLVFRDSHSSGTSVIKC